MTSGDLTMEAARRMQSFPPAVVEVGGVLTRKALTAALLEIRKERGLTRTQMAELFGCLDCQLPTMLDSKKRQVSFDRLLLYFNKLGFEVRFELRRIEEEWEKP